MDNLLVRYATHEAAVPWRDREVARQAQGLYRQAQIADFKAKAGFALAGSIMQGAVELDQLREQLAGGDQARSAMLADFEAVAFQKAKNIQRNLFGDFGF